MLVSLSGWSTTKISIKIYSKCIDFDICKAAPASKEVDDVVNFLIHLKRDVLDGKMDV